MWVQVFRLPGRRRLAGNLQLGLNWPSDNVCLGPCVVKALTDPPPYVEKCSFCLEFIFDSKKRDFETRSNRFGLSCYQRLAKYAQISRWQSYKTRTRTLYVICMPLYLMPAHIHCSFKRSPPALTIKSLTLRAIFTTLYLPRNLRMGPISYCTSPLQAFQA